MIDLPTSVFRLHKYSLALVATLAAACPASAQIENIAVTSAADYSLGIPAPGGIGALFCTGLNVSGVQAAASVPLPTTLAGVQVTIGGYPAPLYAVASQGSYQQVNFQVPANGVGFDTVQVVVTQGTASGSASVAAILDNPGQLFELPNSDATATPVGVFQRLPDFSLITAVSPARSGDNLAMYGSGFVQLQVLPRDGYPAPASPLVVMTPFQMPGSTTLAPDPMPGLGFIDLFQIVIDGTVVVSPQFMGLTPGAVGLGQVNFAVPSLSSGSHTVQMQWMHYLPFPGGLSGIHVYLSKPVMLLVQ